MEKSNTSAGAEPLTPIISLGTPSYVSFHRSPSSGSPTPHPPGDRLLETLSGLRLRDTWVQTQKICLYQQRPAPQPNSPQAAPPLAQWAATARGRGP